VQKLVSLCLSATIVGTAALRRYDPAKFLAVGERLRNRNAVHHQKKHTDHAEDRNRSPDQWSIFLAVSVPV
jgi:hypothetical protein